MQWEYHVMGSHGGIKGVQTELDKRSKDGWELVTAYQETERGRGGDLHWLYFRRPKPQ